MTIGRLGFAFSVDYFFGCFKVYRAGKPLHGTWSEENKNEIWKPSPSLGSGLFAAALRSDFSKFLYHLPGIYFFWSISCLVVCSEDGVNNSVIEIVVGLGKFKIIVSSWLNLIWQSDLVLNYTIYLETMWNKQKWKNWLALGDFSLYGPPGTVFFIVFRSLCSV